MSLTTPSSVQKLQTALHAKAKESPDFRFYALYDKVYRKDVLAHAYERCEANGGAAGVDGQTFTLGDETITIVFTPGTTPGSVSVLVPVTDHGAPHVAAILGGTEPPASSELKNSFITSALHLGKMAEAARVDAELTGYPFVDNAIARMDTLHKAKAGATNPFVIGADGFQRFIGVIAECGWVSLLRPMREP